jgi:hypothetical protein
MNISDRDLKLMERLVKAQTKKAQELPEVQYQQESIA